MTARFEFTSAAHARDPEPVFGQMCLGLESSNLTGLEAILDLGQHDSSTGRLSLLRQFDPHRLGMVIAERAGNDICGHKCRATWNDDASC